MIADTHPSKRPCLLAATLSQPCRRKKVTDEEKSEDNVSVKQGALQVYFSIK